MAVEYDVVIIGGSLAGRYAAIAAAQLRATVALVEPFFGAEGEKPFTTDHSPLATDLCTDAIYRVCTTRHSPLATRHSPLHE